MYCSRRGREVSRPTDTCSRCGRCNWEQDSRKEGKAGLGGLLLGAAILAVAAMLLLR